MNVLVRGYLPWKYIPNWPRNIKHFFRSLKYAYQRITKGYCDSDIWSLYPYYSKILSATLRELAKSLNSYPPELTPIEWNDTLIKMAECFESAGTDFLDGTDEYFDAYLNLKESRKSDIFSDEDTPEEKELLRKSNELAKVNQAKAMEDLKTGLELLCTWWYDLWD